VEVSATTSSGVTGLSRHPYAEQNPILDARRADKRTAPGCAFHAFFNFYGVSRVSVCFDVMVCPFVVLLVCLLARRRREA
jgi:hypothetical protein